MVGQYDISGNENLLTFAFFSYDRIVGYASKINYGVLGKWKFGQLWFYTERGTTDILDLKNTP